MLDEADSPPYWLFFCTRSLRGLEEMKKAMWWVDPRGGFRFSDKDDPCQTHLFAEYTDQALTEELIRCFAGRIVTVGEIEAFVLSETPACKFKDCLKAMEKSGWIRPIDAPPNRRKGTFPSEHLKIEFVARSRS
jgi:hypothetical protein